MKFYPLNMLSRLTSRLLLANYSLFSGKILAVRALCLDEARRIYLVRHTYTPGWHLPGGGVENGMTAEETLHKELKEEGNLIIKGQPRLAQVYLNSHASPREHILLYTAEVRQAEMFHGNLEILEGRFFALDELPSNMHPATARRIGEFVTGHFAATRW
ncbi:NUDIX domain-containing protein [Rhizobium oryzicola]|uniref:NUDIX domain-containing protein n=1 Tax=Rhizobium oryzicola TaxID=1232668 RepID=A0ABT8T5Y4_9HYPH|nr:NUDIX domain-containing protein [Rhizobium oryzicola]MDO1585588.1 NUDIX domain-containing protein [Rhizobium oryzicola]